MGLYDEAYYEHHVGGIPYTYDRPEWRQFFGAMARAIAARLRPGTVMDVGCAKGFLVKELRDRGIEAFGVDASAYAIEHALPEARPHVRVASATDPLPRRYDLITCIEVLEHLSEPSADVAIENLCRHADLVLFSSTPTDLAESTHVNVLPRSYWIEKFARHGFVPDLDFDATFITQQALLFRNRSVPRPHVTVAYYEGGDPSSACPMLRVVGALTHLARRGSATMLRGYYPTETGAELNVRAIGEADVVVVQREFPCHEAAFSRVLARARRRGVPVILELDDLLTDFPPEHPHAYDWLTRSPVMAAALRRVDAVTVSTEFLAAEMARYNDHVYVVPNHIDDDLWPIESAPAPCGDILTIGYIATATHGADFARIAPALYRIRDTYGERVRFHFVGCLPDAARGLVEDPEAPVPRAPYPRVGALVASIGMDIGIAPLLPSRFNRCKSAIKYLEYAAVGAAGVYADLEPYHGFVRDGVTGFLAGPDAEPWHRALVRYIEDRDLLERVRRAAWEDVRANWRLSEGCRHWFDTYARIAAEHGRHGAGGSAGADGPASIARAAASNAALGAPAHSAPTATPLVSIVIPTYNQWEYTERCLRALAAHTAGVPHEVIVVDNASTDGTRERLERLGGPARRERSPNGENVVWTAAAGGALRVHFNDENVGFARACNQGARLARGRYLLFLNNDTEPRAGWLEPLLEAAADPTVGVAGSRLLYPDGRIQHGGVGIAYAAPLPLTIHHLDRFLSADEGGDPPSLELEAVTGACLLIPAALFEELGGFDEAYRNGYEDIDLCLRVRERGRRVLYVPRSVLVHHESVSGGTGRHERENQRLFHERWLGRFTAFDVDPYADAPPRPAPRERPAVSIIIVARDAAATIAPCLENLLRHCGPEDEIIVVDDASADATAPFLDWIAARESGRITVLRNAYPRGQPASQIQGLGRASHDFVLFLDPGALLTAGCIETLYERLAGAAEVGAVEAQPRPIAFASGPSAYAELQDAKAAEYVATVREMHRGRNTQADPVAGRCILMRRSVLERIGGPDRGLFLGGAEIGLAVRLREHGMEVWTAEDAVVFLLGGPPRSLYVERQRLNLIHRRTGWLPAGSDASPRPDTTVMTVVVVARGASDRVRPCLEAVCAHTDGEFELIIVDGGVDGDIEALVGSLNRAGRTTVIAAGAHASPAECFNRGLARAEGGRIALLDVDTRVTPGWLSRAAAIFGCDPRVGVVAPHSTETIGDAEMDSRPDSGDLDALAIQWALERSGKSRYCPTVPAAGMIVSRALIEKIGGFDAGFVRDHFAEDFCLRSWRAGFRVALAEDVYLGHRAAADAPAPDARSADWERFCRKWSHEGRPGAAYDAERLVARRAFDPALDHVPLDAGRTPDAVAASPIEIGGAREVKLLCIPDWDDSGWRRVVAEYAAAFGPADPVSLVVRIEPPTPAGVDRAWREVATLLAELGVDAESEPDIVLEATDLGAGGRARLYAAVTAFVPCGGERSAEYVREARAHGLPVLAAPSREALLEGAASEVGALG